MSGYIEGVDRSQATLFPDRLEDWIDDDNPVCVIDLFVDEIDLEKIGFLRTAPASTGRPGYRPSVLLKLFIYVWDRFEVLVTEDFWFIAAIMERR